MDVRDILDHFLKTSGLDAGTREGANAYKLDDAAECVKWAEEVGLAMSALTGPEAPHYFRICRRKHLGTLTACGDGATEAATCHRAEQRGYQPNGNNVVIVVKDHMASLEVSQIILMVPAADLGRLHGLPLQPQGTRLRRPTSDRDNKSVHDAALMVHHAGAINKKAWGSRGLPRPSYYNFLEPGPRSIPT